MAYNALAGVAPYNPAGLAQDIQAIDQRRFRNALASRQMNLMEQEGNAKSALAAQQQAQAQDLAHAKSKYALARYVKNSPNPKATYLANVDAQDIAQLQQRGIDVNSMNDEQVRQMASQAEAHYGSILGVPPDDGIEFGKYNPGDYTPDSFATFVKTRNPMDLKRYVTPAQPAMAIINGVPTIVNKATGGTTPLSNPASEADAARKKAEAEAAGRTTGAGNAERQLQLPEAKARLAATQAKFDRLSQAAQRVLDDKGLWQAVGLGRGLSMIPSSAGANVLARIKSLQSQAGLAVLQDMRDNSKTGGAVGQVSNFEQEIFQNALGAIGNLNQSPEAYRQALEDIKNYARTTKMRFEKAFNDTYPELSGGKPAGNGDSAGNGGWGAVRKR